MRKTGYYWLKQYGSAWEIGFYNEDTKEFSLVLDDELYVENIFEEIDINRINKN